MDGFRLENLGTRCLPIPPEMHCVKETPLDIDSNQVYDLYDAEDKLRFVYDCLKCEAGYFRKKIEYTFTTTE